MQLEDLSNILQQSRQLYTEAEISTAYDDMAEQITKDLGTKLPLILCVMNGGLVLTGELLRRMNFPLEVDYVHATRYHGNTYGGEVQWLRFPNETVKDRDILIVDDILDEGITLQQLQEACLNEGAKSVHSAVLAIKQHDRRKRDIKVDYSGLNVEDSFVVGCGMDYYGYFRNLNTIYALEDLGKH